MMPGPPPVMTATSFAARSSPARRAALYRGSVRRVRADPNTETAGPSSASAPETVHELRLDAHDAPRVHVQPIRSILGCKQAPCRGLLRNIRTAQDNRTPVVGLVKGRRFFRLQTLVLHVPRLFRHNHHSVRAGKGRIPSPHAPHMRYARAMPHRSAMAASHVTRSSMLRSLTLLCPITRQNMRTSSKVAR